MSTYTIGVDFGTESGRAVLVDLADGRTLASGGKDNTVRNNILCFSMNGQLQRSRPEAVEPRTDARRVRCR